MALSLFAILLFVFSLFCNLKGASDLFKRFDWRTSPADMTKEELAFRRKCLFLMFGPVTISSLLCYLIFNYY